MCIYHIYKKIHTSMLSCFCHSLITPEFGWLYPQFQSLWPRRSLFSGFAASLQPNPNYFSGQLVWGVVSWVLGDTSGSDSTIGFWKS